MNTSLGLEKKQCTDSSTVTLRKFSLPNMCTVHEPIIEDSSELKPAGAKKEQELFALLGQPRYLPYTGPPPPPPPQGSTFLVTERQQSSQEKTGAARNLCWKCSVGVLPGPATQQHHANVCYSLHCLKGDQVFPIHFWCLGQLSITPKVMQSRLSERDKNKERVKSCKRKTKWALLHTKYQTHV